jgi:NTP pyrophosphatase (non-canonical NTP hydrolase)
MATRRDSVKFSEIVDLAEQIRAKYDELNAKKGREPWRGKDYAQGFVGDVGDLAKLVMARENLREIDETDAKLKHELSDCLWSVIIIAQSYGIDLEKEFLRAMRELEIRVEKEEK